MRSPSYFQSCPLCQGVVNIAEMASHLRALHQVGPDEATTADVPVGRKNWLRVAQASMPLEEDLVLVKVSARKTLSAA